MVVLVAIVLVNVKKHNDKQNEINYNIQKQIKIEEERLSIENERNALLKEEAQRKASARKAERDSKCTSSTWWYNQIMTGGDTSLCD